MFYETLKYIMIDFVLYFVEIFYSMYKLKTSVKNHLTFSHENPSIIRKYS